MDMIFLKEYMYDMIFKVDLLFVRWGWGELYIIFFYGLSDTIC